MITLSKPKDNLGGVLKIWAVPPFRVVSILSGILTLSGTDDVVELYVSPESAVAKCDLKRGPGGVYYEITVEGFTPGIREEIETLFSAMAGRDYLVVLQDGNGRFQVAGSREEPLHFSFQASTGEMVAERSGYQIQFSRSCTRGLIEIARPF